MNTYFISQKAREDFVNRYNTWLDKLNQAYEVVKIETSFGITNVILTGDEAKPPLVVLHAANSNGVCAIRSLKSLLSHFRVIVIDIIGQPNLSAEYRPDNHKEYGLWLFEILTRLSIKNALLIGVDLGAYVAMEYFQFDQKRIQKAYLISPVGIVENEFIKSRVGQDLLSGNTIREWSEDFLNLYVKSHFTNPVPFTFEYYSHMSKVYALDMADVSVLTDNHFENIKIPITIISGDYDVCYPWEKLSERVRKLNSRFIQHFILPASQHFPDDKGYRLIYDLLI